MTCLTLSLLASNDISLRLNPSFYDEATETVYVDVEVRYDGRGQFRLADQNYRLFYDSDLLQLKQDFSRSDLPQDLYSQLQFMEILEGLEADAVNQLSFDDQLGFINFNIGLEDVAHGGIAIEKDDLWHRVAVLNFAVKDKDMLSEIVWSETGKTDGYATAFVEIMEWLAPNETEPATINEYVAASFHPENDEEKKNIDVYPNPSRDFIKVSFLEEFDEHLSVNIYNSLGIKVITTTAYRGANHLNIAITRLIPGSYNIEIVNPTSEMIVSRSTFVKID